MITITVIVMMKVAIVMIMVMVTRVLALIEWRRSIYYRVFSFSFPLD